MATKLPGRALQDRRSVRVGVTEDGRPLVDQVSQARREELQLILSRLPTTGRYAPAEAFRAFSSVAEEGWGK